MNRMFSSSSETANVRASIAQLKEHAKKEGVELTFFRYRQMFAPENDGIVYRVDGFERRDGVDMTSASDVTEVAAEII